MIDFKFHEDSKASSHKRFEELRKEIVLHSSSSFNDKNLNVYNCLETLTNLIYLLNQGEKFSHSEKENLFFNVTKLLHSQDSELKRLVFIFINHLQSIDNYFILTGPLLNEINGENIILKTTGLRTIGHIIDLSNIAVVKRHLETALFHKTTEISNAAILCTYYLTLKGSDFAKAWIRELTDKINTALSQPNLQTFHLMILLNEIKQNDKLFLMKLFQTLCSPNLKSQFAKCQLIRYIIGMISRGEIEDQKVFNTFHSYLEQCLQKHQPESVIIEAARGVIETPIFKNTIFINAIESMKVILSKERKVFKYAALKTLDRAATVNPNINALDFFIELEKIIDDSSNNASMKALAFSIFLKISKSLSSTRLEKMFKTFTDQYNTFKEEFKKEVIVISKVISRQDPTKLKLYFNFFSNLIKLEASYPTKDELVDCIIWFIHHDKELKRNAVFCLADYIEDCEFDKIKTKILNVLGKEGGHISSSSQLIRLIYNRIILENPIVRCAAISALGEIANSDSESRPSVLNLIKRSLNDSDHEVRERAYFYSKIITGLIKEAKIKENTKSSENINENLEKEEDNLYMNNKNTNNDSSMKLKKYAFCTKGYDVDVLQNILQMQKESLLLSRDISGDLSQVLSDPDRIAKMLINQGVQEDKKNLGKDGEHKKAEGKDKKDESKSDISSVLTKAYGNPKLITKYTKLTDQYAEITVAYRKLVMDNVVIIDIELINTLEDVLNEILNNDGFDLSKTEIIEVEQLKFNEQKHLYLKLSKKEEQNYPICNFGINLKFEVQEIDAKGNPHGNSYTDSYKINKKVEVKFSDYFKFDPSVRVDNFENNWKLAEESDYHVFEEKLQLPFNTIKAAGKNISDLLGMDPLNDIEKVDMNAKKYEFIFYALSLFETRVLIRLQVVLVPQNSQCISRVLIRTQDENLGDLIINSLLKN